MIPIETLTSYKPAAGENFEGFVSLIKFRWHGNRICKREKSESLEKQKNDDHINYNWDLRYELA